MKLTGKPTTKLSSSRKTAILKGNGLTAIENLKTPTVSNGLWNIRQLDINEKQGKYYIHLIL
jgi:hypothetical protein